MGEPVIVRDFDALSSWHADWSSLRVAVLGLGVTGFAVADTLVELGATVLVVAARADSDHARLLGVIGAGLVEHTDPSTVPSELVELDPELVVVSPGFHPDHAWLEWAAARQIPIWGDIELAWRVRDKVARVAEWVLVTGTNGKTTTVQLTAHVLRQGGLRAVEVGNIGVPVLDAVRDPIGFDALVVELSSYQLHWLPRSGVGALAPLASVCLNLADDHLDWHGSAGAYRDAKATVYWNTRVACVYNLADAATMTMVEDAEVEEGCRAIGFGRRTPGPSELGIVDDIVVDRAFLDDRRNTALELTTHGELVEAGLSAPHLVDDVLAAAALARACGIEPRDVRDAIATFRLDHHRTELVASSDGVEWVDDSKATNPHAADAALRAKPSVVWIVGGLLKGVDISELVLAHAKRLRAVIVIGVDRAGVRSAFERHAPETPLFEIETADTGEVMPEAVRRAASVALEGDTVLLAPAAASMDQFRDYADRGAKFAAAVRAHIEESSGGAGDVDDAHPDHPPSD